MSETAVTYLNNIFSILMDIQKNNANGDDVLESIRTIFSMIVNRDRGIQLGLHERMDCGHYDVLVPITSLHLEDIHKMICTVIEESRSSAVQP